MKKFLILALLLISQNAIADDDGEIKCSHAEDASSQAQAACIYEEFNAADAELNKIYAQKIAEAKQKDAITHGKNEAELRKAQRAWLKSSIQTCKDQPDEGGTLYNSEVADCRLDLTKKRIKELSK